MSITPLALVKEHLRIAGDYDDATLTAYLAAAEGYLAGVGVKMDADPFPAAITAAVLLLTGHLYANRETTAIGASVSDIPFGVDRLIAPYREATA